MGSPRGAEHLALMHALELLLRMASMCTLKLLLRGPLDENLATLELVLMLGLPLMTVHIFELVIDDTDIKPSKDSAISVQFGSSVFVSADCSPGACLFFWFADTFTIVFREGVDAMCVDLRSVAYFGAVACVGAKGGAYCEVLLCAGFWIVLCGEAGVDASITDRAGTGKEFSGERKPYFGALVDINMVSGAHKGLRAHMDTDADARFELCDDDGDDIYVDA
uniref:Uncharacterized protein n=1 Tax=Glossina austeni TaxID=7395 RepID=A0A1A9VAW7_GLOAU